MSEHEKTLRRALLSEVREYAHGGGARVEAALTALLAEHRAEVERLRAALAESGGAWRADAASARDAALEEAARVIEVPGKPHAPLSLAALGIRALQSRPASVVPVEKVREVLCDLQPGADLLHGKYAQGVRDALLQVADVLGIDLDATSERVAASQAKGALEDGAPCVCGHDIGWHWYGKNRGCMKKMPETGNSTCPCKAWTRASDAVTP